MMTDSVVYVKTSQARVHFRVIVLCQSVSLIKDVKFDVKSLKNKAIMAIYVIF